MNIIVHCSIADINFTNLNFLEDVISAIYYVHVSVWFPVLYMYSILYTRMLCACVAYCIVPYTLYICMSELVGNQYTTHMCMYKCT